MSVFHIMTAVKVEQLKMIHSFNESSIYCEDRAEETKRLGFIFSLSLAEGGETTGMCLKDEG